jgi:hypothetical protein
MSTTKMSIRQSINNIEASLNKAQAKGAFSIRESAFIFSSLQKLNDFVNKFEKQDELLPQLTPAVSEVLKIVDEENKENKEPFAELQLEQAEETIEI